jgi:hypothetical protein
VGDHPWNERGPALDMTAATALGYVPVGSYADTVLAALDSLVSAATARGVDAALDEDAAAGLARYLDYSAEDAFLAAQR